MALTLQDLTTYTKVDPSNWFTSITSARVDWTGLNRNASAHLTDDKGAGNIDMTKLAYNFKHKSTSVAAGAQYAFFTVSTVANDIIGMGDVPRMIIFSNPTALNNDRFFFAMGFPPGNSWIDNAVNTGINTERLMVGSISPNGLTYTLIIYAGNVVGPVFDTLTFTATSPCPDTRYTYAPASFNAAQNNPATGYGKDYYIDIDGVAAATFNRSRIVNMGVTGPQNRSTIANA
jgi:hypothetical protein